MAKKSLVVKASRPQKFKVRNYTRCRRCGRPRAVYRKFGLCRICLRELALRAVHGDEAGAHDDGDAVRHGDGLQSDPTHRTTR